MNCFKLCPSFTSSVSQIQLTLFQTLLSWFLIDMIAEANNNYGCQNNNTINYAWTMVLLVGTAFFPTDLH